MIWIVEGPLAFLRGEVIHSYPTATEDPFLDKIVDFCVHNSTVGVVDARGAWVAGADAKCWRNGRSREERSDKGGFQMDPRCLVHQAHRQTCRMDAGVPVTA
jgi:hypothetical protein